MEQTRQQGVFYITACYRPVHVTFYFRHDYLKALHVDPLCLSARVNLGYNLQVTNVAVKDWRIDRLIDCQLLACFPSSQAASLTERRTDRLVLTVCVTCGKADWLTGWLTACHKNKGNYHHRGFFMCVTFLCLKSVDLLTDWRTDWLTYWQIDWLTGWLTDLQIDWLSEWPAIWLTDWWTNKQADGRTNGRTDWPTDLQTDWLIDWMTDWLAGWLTDWLPDGQTGGKTDGPTDWLIDWLTDWLTDWLIDCLSVLLIISLSVSICDRLTNSLAIRMSRWPRNREIDWKTV